MRSARDIPVQPLPRITYTPRADATPEAELSALAAIYTLVLSNSQAKRGGTHDLTNESIKVECPSILLHDLRMYALAEQQGSGLVPKLRVSL